MDAKELRMRCIESVAAMGVREPTRLITDAKKLEEWIREAKEDEPVDNAKVPIASPKVPPKSG